MVKPLKKSELEAHIDWTRVGADELALIEQLDGAANGDYEKIIRELTRRGVLQLPENGLHVLEGGVEAAGETPGKGAFAMVKSLFGRFFAE